jgi:integrase
MSRRRQPPHLIWVKPKYTKEGKLRANGYWAIADGPKRIGTGFGLESRADAEKARLEYEVRLYAEKSAAQVVAENGKSARDVLVVDLIKAYLERNKARIEEKSADRLRDYLNTVERLIRFWSGKTVYDINEKSIAEYQATARSGKPLSDNHALREMQDLKAMVNQGIRKGLCELNGHVIDWELPDPPPARMEFYSRSEIARLIWTAYRARNMAIGGPKGHKTSLHVARFILLAVYTGSRAEVVDRARYVETDGHPWIDLERGIFFRAWNGRRVPNNKRAEPVRIPDKLVTMMRRWAKEGDDFVRHNKKSGRTRRAFYSLKKRVLSADRMEQVNAHTLKHTCASWLVGLGVPYDTVADYISTSPEVVKKHYAHFAPDFHQEVMEAWKRRPHAEKKLKGKAEKQSDAA